ncbi:MAG: WbqC family protein [Nitrospinae bacterium]|nr:WbqC family protein [Nitrospinota bacterium]
MRIAILQPSYLPWLGFFDQMAKVDTFVLLDDIQYTRRDWRNRNRIRIKDGWAWITVPVIQKDRFEQSLLETEIDNSVNWRAKHLRAIQHGYSRAPYFKEYFPYFESLYCREWDLLVDLCCETIRYLKEALKIKTPILRSSELGAGGTKGGRILAICQKLEAGHYLTGDKARDYLSEEEFLSRKTILEYHNYVHPEYRQSFPGFVPYLSVVDLLFNHGEDSLGILMKG